YDRCLERPFEVAHQGLEDVGGRDEPLDVTALVDHQDKGQVGPFEGRDGLRGGGALREEAWRAQGAQEVGGLSRADLSRQGVFYWGHAQQVVQVAADDRIVGVPALRY